MQWRRLATERNLRGADVINSSKGPTGIGINGHPPRKFAFARFKATTDEHMQETNAAPATLLPPPSKTLRPSIGVAIESRARNF